jgi:hypothetical protein
MKIVYKFIQLENLDKVILIKTILLAWIIRIILWIFPFSVLQKLVDKVSKKPQKLKHVSLKKLVWAVNIASKYSPKSTCLTRSITGYILLSRYGYSTKIKIGVSKSDKSNLDAHAWLENNDNVVIGKSKKKYTTILNLGGN